MVPEGLIIAESSRDSFVKDASILGKLKVKARSEKEGRTYW